MPGRHILLTRGDGNTFPKSELLVKLATRHIRYTKGVFKSCPSRNKSPIRTKELIEQRKNVAPKPVEANNNKRIDLALVRKMTISASAI
jgi:hypothetical protein